MNRRQRVLLMLTVAAGLGAAGTIGWAFFSAPGSGQASAGVTSLAAPSGVTVPSSIVGTTVHVSWTGVVAPDGSSTVGYWVRRFAGSTATDACGSSHASPIAAGSGAKSCDDTSVASGTYTYTVTAVFRSWTTVSSASASVSVVTLDHFTVSAPSSATAGSPFSVTVAARDASNNTITHYTGTVHFTTSDAHSPSLPSDYTFVAGDNGSHTFSNAVTLTTAGSQTVSVNDTSQTTKVGTSGTIAVAGAGLDHFVVTAPASATAGTAFSTTTVSALDTYGNIANGWATATQCVAFSGPANAPNGTAPVYPARSACAVGQSSLSFDASGQATAAGITLYKAQSVALTVTASSKTGSSGAIAVGAAGIDHFNVAAPANATVATAFTSATATAHDLYDNPASGWTSTAHCVTFSGPASAPNGTAPNYPAQGACAAGQSSVTFDASAQAAGFSVTLYRAETHALTVTDPATSKTGTSSAIVVAAGPAASFVVTAPASATAGTQFGVTSLSARDAYSNTATGYTGTHTIAWSGPANAPSGTAPTFPATAVAFTSGVSTTTLNATLVKAESATLTASETSGPSGSASITVSAGSATNFLVSAPSSATAGTQFSVTSLTARDTFNNTATAYTGTHTIAWSGPSNAPSGTAPTLPTATVAFTNGVSTTTLNATLVKAETATLTAKEGTTPSGSATITVSAGAAAKLAWTNPTSSFGSASGVCLFTCTWGPIGRGNPWTAQVSVTDANGNIVSGIGAGHTVTLVVGGVGAVNPASLSLPSSGAATTATLTFTSKNGNGWSSDNLTASATGYSSATVTFNM